MTVVIPEYETAQGNIKVAFVPAIAAPAAPTVAELTAATAVDLSTYLLGDWAGVTAEQNKGEQRRFASTQTFEQLGFTKLSAAKLQYTYLPQEIGTDPANKAKTNLAEGTTGYLVLRYGVAAPTAFTIADKVDVFPAECGFQNKMAAAGDEFAPLTIDQEIAVTGLRVEGTVA